MSEISNKDYTITILLKNFYRILVIKSVRPVMFYSPHANLQIPSVCIFIIRRRTICNENCY
jgi:hypothetical protein